ncbi:MAG: glycosyltransferase family 2 protein [Pararhodobacter sp.]
MPPTALKPVRTDGSSPPLGMVMLEQGTLSAAALVRALTLQTRHDALLGSIVQAHDLADEAAVMHALATQHGTTVLDPARHPLDPRLIDTLGPTRWLQMRCLPWQRAGGVTLLACADPATYHRHRAEIVSALGPVSLVMAPLSTLHRAIADNRRAALRLWAETCVAEPESCRRWGSTRFSLFLGGGLLAVLIGAAIAPLLVFSLCLAVVLMALFAGTALKIAAAIARFHMPRPAALPTDPVVRRRQRPRKPVVSLMVPLYREPAIAARLVRRLQALTYPRELLDVMIVVEEDDRVTRDALAKAQLPRWMRVIPVPESQLKTKPRALNYALNFALGEIVGVYDAEDAPAHDQLHRVVEAFAAGGPDLACVQGVLDYYNPGTNWLARCFTIEYAAWFRVILPGMERLGLAVPLGGTTLFFRRDALERLGGWDAHNVTEDADLGIRLARYGYRTTLIDSVTLEEANCRLWPWVKQRSRWLKGYAMTYAVHMRRPALLWQQLGWWRFIGFQILFLGTLIQFLLAPILWSFWLMLFGLGHPLAAALPLAGAIALATLFLCAEVANLTVNIVALSGRRHRWLRPWALTLHLYFPLAAVAAWKGLWEMVVSPYYWDKTTHGLHDSTLQPALSAT